ncbi:MAG: hypothetical protein KAT34_00185 [Candidatus Aminicenantes bacterium]|nr:hypothetical protein [Candidatus Aminicenantes bacterium]
MSFSVVNKLSRPFLRRRKKVFYLVKNEAGEYQKFDILTKRTPLIFPLTKGFSARIFLASNSNREPKKYFLKFPTLWDYCCGNTCYTNICSGKKKPDSYLESDEIERNHTRLIFHKLESDFPDPEINFVDTKSGKPVECKINESVHIKLIIKGGDPNWWVEIKEPLSRSRHPHHHGNVDIGDER